LNQPVIHYGKVIPRRAGKFSFRGNQATTKSAWRFGMAPHQPIAQSLHGGREQENEHGLRTKGPTNLSRPLDINAQDHIPSLPKRTDHRTFRRPIIGAMNRRPLE
jgi:hypothetical protein